MGSTPTCPTGVVTNTSIDYQYVFNKALITINDAVAKRPKAEGCNPSIGGSNPSRVSMPKTQGNDDVQLCKNGVLRTKSDGIICRIVYADEELAEAVRETVQHIVEKRRCKEAGMTEENTIASGTIVSLRSGGPWMTVGERGTDGQLTCYWFDEYGNVFSSTFHPLALLLQDENESLPRLDFVEYAERAYVAYGDKADWKNFKGDPMPAWGDLPPNIHTYWTAAVTQIIADWNSMYNASR